MASYLITTDQGDTLELEHHGVKGMKWGVRKDRGPSKYQNYKMAIQTAKANKKASMQKIKDNPSAKWITNNNRKGAVRSTYIRAKHQAKFERKGGQITDKYTKRMANRDMIIYGGKGAARISKSINKNGMNPNSARAKEFGRQAITGVAAVAATYMGVKATTRAVTAGKKAMNSGMRQVIWNQVVSTARDDAREKNPLYGTKNARKYARGMARNARKGVEFVSGM